MSSLRQRFEDLEQPYWECYDLYQDTLSTITGKPEIFNTITLSMLKNKNNDQSVNTIKEAIQKRMFDLKSAPCPPEPRRDSPVCSENSTGASNHANLSDSMLSTDTYSVEKASFDSANPSPNLAPSKSRTLRVLIAGDINAGKTSVLNLFLGNEYLPVSSTKCTTVPCEVHNSTQRFARVIYHEGTSTLPEDIALPVNNRDSRWEDVGKLVRVGKYNGKAVQRLLLFWPLSFFDESVSAEFGPESGIESLAESDPDQTNVKQVVNTARDPDGTTSKTVAVDDADQTNVKQVVSLFENMLENVKKEITRHGIDFNPESALFLLNRSDLYQPAKGEDRIEKVILSAIQPKWPMVGEEQLYRLSCIKIKSGCMEALKEKMCNFLEAANRLNLEEHYLWLINLLEDIHAFFDTSVHWLPYDTSLQKIKDYAKQDNVFLEKELGILEDKKSSFYKHIMQEAKKSEDELRTHIEDNTGDSTADLDQKLRSMMKDGQVQKIRKDFDSELKTFLGQHRTRLKKNVKLVEYLEDQCKLTLDMNDVLNTIATLVSIPLASFILAGRSLTEEIDAALSAPKDIKISRRTQYFVKQAEAAIQQETSFIISQLQIRREIIWFEFRNNRNREERKLEKLDTSLKKLWEIYIQKVLKHKFSFDDVKRVTHGVSNTVDVVQVKNASRTEDLARKRLKSGVGSDGSMLPQNHNVFRELVIMRSLARKDSKNCVMFRGSSSWIEGGKQILAIMMEKADKNLVDVIMELERSQIGLKKRLQFALGAARGLEYLHRNRHIHQEVKPRHFLVYQNQDSGEDIVKICDFGHVIEKFVPVTTASDPTIVAYYAPELFGQAARHSIMSDVYSLGLVIWELYHCRKITCNPGEPPSFREVPKGELKTLIKSCLDVQPKRRPKSHKIVQILSSLVRSK